MRHRKYTFKVRRNSEHRKAMLANLACSLINSGRIETSLTKAKEARRLTEKMITLAKRGTLHCRRQAISRLRCKDTANYLFEELAPQFNGRPGGYTRMYKMGPRTGDGTEMALIELVTEPMETEETAETPTQNQKTDVETSEQREPENTAE